MEGIDYIWKRTERKILRTHQTCKQGTICRHRTKDVCVIKGKYPRKFEEKYKELQPEKYKETAEHIIQKGNTPAGTHRPICVEEILSFLDVKPGQIGVDATLGYGGHTQKILDCR